VSRRPGRPAAILRRRAVERFPLLHRARGPAALMLGAVLFAAMAICVKFAAQRIPSGELVMFRFLFGLATIYAMSALGLAQVRHDRPVLLMARGFTGALAILLYFASIQHTSLVKASLLSNSYPVYAALFGALLLRERPSAATIGAFLAAACGIWLVVDPDFSSVNPGISSACFLARWRGWPSSSSASFGGRSPRSRSSVSVRVRNGDGRGQLLLEFCVAGFP